MPPQAATQTKSDPGSFTFVTSDGKPLSVKGLKVRTSGNPLPHYATEQEARDYLQANGFRDVMTQEERNSQTPTMETIPGAMTRRATSIIQSILPGDSLSDIHEPDVMLARSGLNPPAIVTAIAQSEGRLGRRFGQQAKSRDPRALFTLLSMNPFSAQTVADMGEEVDKGNISGARGTGIIDALLLASLSRPGSLLKGESNLPKTGLMRKGLRSYMGIGNRMTLRTAAEALAEREKSAKVIDEDNAAATAKHKDALTRTESAQNRIYDVTSKANETAHSQHEALVNRLARQNREALQEHREATRKVEELNSARREAVSRRASLANQILNDSKTLSQRVKALEKQVRGSASAKYQAVDAATHGDSVPASDLAQAVRHAETDIIKGSTEEIKQFREIVRRGEAQPIQTSMGVAKPGSMLYESLNKQGLLDPTERLKFRDLQGYYTEIGLRMQADLPGDVYRALKYVREQIGQQMLAMADKNGVGDQLKEAQAAWRDYENTFHDMRSVAQGGSPVARILRAEDPGYASAPLLGKASERAIGQIDKYDPELAILARHIHDNHQAMQSLPSKLTTKEPPRKPTLKEMPAPPNAKVPRILDMPRRPELKPPPEYPNVLSKVAEKRADRILGVSRNLRSVSGWDIASITGGMYQIARGDVPSAFGITVLRHGAGALLDHPKVVEWLSAPTREDFKQLDKLPESDREQVKSAVRSFYAKRAAEGRPVSMNRAVREFLGKTARVSLTLAPKDRDRSLARQLKIAESIDAPAWAKWAERIRKAQKKAKESAVATPEEEE